MSSYDDATPTEAYPTARLSASATDEPQSESPQPAAMPGAAEGPSPRGVHVGYLVSGLIFLSIAAMWGLGQLLIVDVDDAARFAAIALIATGGAGLLAWWAGSVRKRD